MVSRRELAHIIVLTSLWTPSSIQRCQRKGIRQEGVGTLATNETVWTAEKCLELARQIKDVVFCTVDEKGLPQARFIDVMGQEGERIWFCTARGKDFYRQLVRDGHVALAGMNDRWQTVRVTGEARRLPHAEQHAWIDRIFADNPSMEGVYPGEARYVPEAFVIDAGSVEFFDLGCHPIERASFSFGGASAPKAGFAVTSACIGCGTCVAACPQGAIELTDDGVAHIAQEHCLHCGRCAEVCPVGAIERRGE